jgi:glycosyltransferase involved in cell wall biosynthesis
MRNEAEHIKMSLRRLMAQDYPTDKMEILVMDDFSDDESAALVKAFDDVRLRLCLSWRLSGTVLSPSAQ